MVMMMLVIIMLKISEEEADYDVDDDVADYDVGGDVADTDDSPSEEEAHDNDDVFLLPRRVNQKCDLMMMMFFCQEEFDV